jgi:hypothetical protein
MLGLTPDRPPTLPTLSSRPTPTDFLTRPQLLTRCSPLPMGRDMSPSSFAVAQIALILKHDHRGRNHHAADPWQAVA